MAKISALLASSALTGVESLPVIQGGATRRSTVSEIWGPSEAWRGRVNGWSDPYNRSLALQVGTFNGRPAWHAVDAAAWASVSFVKNTDFEGRALRKSGTGNLCGRRLNVADAGYVPGDVVSVSSLFRTGVGGAGGTVTKYIRCLDVNGGVIAGSGQVTAVADNGVATSIVTSATRQRLTATVAIPVGCGFIWEYWVCAAAGQDADQVAIWATAATFANSPKVPPPGDDAFMHALAASARLTAAEGRLTVAEAILATTVIPNAGRQIRGAYVPDVVWASPLGDDETLGDATFNDQTVKVMGHYERVAEATLFNAIDLRMWASNAGTAVEWRVYLRDTLAPFNWSDVAPDAAGSIAAGVFPITNRRFTLNLAAPLFAAPNKYVIVATRAVDGSGMNCRRWLYNAAVVPARHGFPFSTAGGWNAVWAMAGPTIGYGQPALKLRLRSSEARELSERVAELEAQAAVAPAVAADLTGLPPVIRVLQDAEAAVYFHGITRQRVDLWDVNVDPTLSAGIGRQQRERWVAYGDGVVRDTTLTFVLEDPRTGAPAVSRTARLITGPRIAAPRSERGLLPGDSLIGTGHVATALAALSAADPKLTVTLLGPMGAGAARHHGLGGTSIDDWIGPGAARTVFTVSGVTTPPTINSAVRYTQNGRTYTPQDIILSGGGGTIICSHDGAGGAPAASGVLTKTGVGDGDGVIAYSAQAAGTGNPFWIGGGLNYGGYLTARGYDAAPPNWVGFCLSSNDGYPRLSEAEAVAEATADAPKFVTLAQHLRAHVSAPQVLIIQPPFGALSQDAWGSSYGEGQTAARFKRNMAIMNDRVAMALAGIPGVFVLETGTAVDPVHGYGFAAPTPVNARSTTLVTRQFDGIHPALPGAAQMADVIWAQRHLQGV